MCTFAEAIKVRIFDAAPEHIGAINIIYAPTPVTLPQSIPTMDQLITTIKEYETEHPPHQHDQPQAASSQVVTLEAFHDLLSRVAAIEALLQQAFPPEPDPQFTQADALAEAQAAAAQHAAATSTDATMAAADSVSAPADSVSAP